MSLNEELNEFVRYASENSEFARMFKSHQWINGNLITTLLTNKHFNNLEHIDSVVHLIKSTKNDIIAAEKELVPRLSEAININRLRNLYMFYYKKYQCYPNMSSEEDITNTMNELYKLNTVERLPEDIYNVVKEFTKKLNTIDESKHQANVNRILHLVCSVENDMKGLKKEPKKIVKETSNEALHETSKAIFHEPSNEQLKHNLYERCPNILKGWNKYESMMKVMVTVDDSIIEAYLNYYFEHPNEKPKNLIEQLSTLFKNKDKRFPLKTLKEFKPIFNIAIYMALDSSISEDFDINILRKEGVPKDILMELL